MKRVLIVGSEGQDGQWLKEAIVRRGDSFLGVSKLGFHSPTPGWENQKLSIRDAGQVAQLVREYQPQEVYYLPAVHFSSEEKLPDEIELYEASMQINVASLVYFLEAIRKYHPSARLFYAASSHVFGTPPSQVQDEETPFNPTSIYGISKAAGIHSCRYYRAQHGIFASSGILYNHESTRRSHKFLSQRIVQGALAIKRGESQLLEIGDLSARVDWGYAPDFVEAMQRQLQLPEPTDLVIATGVPHTVLDFVQVAFSALGLDYRKYVKELPARLEKKHTDLIGNPAKLKRLTGWNPSLNFEEMIAVMLKGGESI